MNVNCKWRSLMGVAAIGVFAFSVSLYGGERLSRVTKDVAPQDNVVAKQTLVGYEIIHSLEALPPQMVGKAEPLPLGVPIPIWDVHQDGSPVLDGRVAADSACNAIVYRQPNDSGYFFPFGKGMDIGNMVANPFNLGNGFVAGNALCAYDTMWYNSVSGFGEAAVECALWDGDPFGIYDTSGTGAAITGTECTWTNLRQGGYDTLGCFQDGDPLGTPCNVVGDCTNPICVDGYMDGDIGCGGYGDHSGCGLCPAFADPWDEATETGCAGMYKLVCSMDPPVVIPNSEPWLVCSVLEGCRPGIRSAWYFAPDVGAGGGAFGCAGVTSACTDAVEETYDVGQKDPYEGVGTCCDTGAPCDHSDMLTSNDCSHVTYCSSGVATVSDAWYYGAPTYYASFVATAYAMSEAYLSLVPVSSDPPGVIVGNEITMEAAGAKVWLQVQAEGWAPALLKTWQATIDPAGYHTGCAGFLTPWNPACASDAECVTALGAGSWCGDLAGGYPPLGCCPGFQDGGTTPNLFLGIDAVATSDLYFAYGSTGIGSTLADDGSTFYGGTLVLDVDVTAKGTFEIGFVLGTATFMKDDGNQAIPLIGAFPAKVTVEIGRCLFNVGTPGVDCIDDCVTKAECDAQPGVTVFDTTKTCADPWIDCTEDEHCGDTDACTVDTCNVIFMCEHAAVSVPAGACCDPTCTEGDPDDIGGGGTIAYYDDGNECTDDACSIPPDHGVVVNAPVPDYTDCEVPWNQCWKQECMSGVCEAPVDINTWPCAADGDCFLAENPSAYCDLGTNLCVCISCFTDLPCYYCDGTSPNSPLNPGCDPNVPDDCGYGVDCLLNTWACRADLKFDFADQCYDVDDKVIVTVKFENSLKVVNGAQFTVNYDPDCLDFNSISPAGAPYVFEMMEVVDEAAGTIFYAVGVDPMGGSGVADTGNLAIISFDKVGVCVDCTLDFSGANPANTYLTDDEGQMICADPFESDEITAQDELWIECPDGDDVNVDCDMVTAEVYWDEPTAGSDCGDEDDVTLVCSGTYPDMSVVPQDVVMGGGEFPIGDSVFTCTVTSLLCGDTLDCTWTVTVNAETTLDVVVQLSPVIMADDLCRCIDFELYADCVQDPFLMEECLRFGGMWDHEGHFTEALKIPAAGQWFCITAGDQLHTLRSMAYLECVDGVYYATFKGDPFFSGNWLVGGNLDAFKKDNPNASHDVIDILDFGQFVANYMAIVNPDTCTRNPDLSCLDCIQFPDGNADINGDGVVNALDFAFIQMNFLEHSKDACCPGSTATIPTGRTEVSLRELRAMDLSDLSVADLNGDGLLNMDDMAAFMAGDVPSKPDRGNRGAGIR